MVDTFATKIKTVGHGPDCTHCKEDYSLQQIRFNIQVQIVAITPWENV